LSPSEAARRQQLASHQQPPTVKRALVHATSVVSTQRLEHGTLTRR
jgi:hypothetical protein